jgi:hypothetical protein
MTGMYVRYECDLGHIHLALTCGSANRALKLVAKPQVRDMGVQLPLGVLRLVEGIVALADRSGGRGVRWLPVPAGHARGRGPLATAVECLRLCDLGRAPVAEDEETLLMSLLRCC